MVFLIRSYRHNSVVLIAACCLLLYLLFRQPSSFPTLRLTSAHPTSCQRHYPKVDPSNICATFIMPSKQSYFIALNLYNSEPILAALETEILRLIFTLRTCSTVAEHVFVSVYESGSTDNTPLMLEQLAIMLNHFQVPNKIVTRGRWTREAIKPRIEHLAKIRNAVLEPLYNQPRYTYTQIIFLNDVLFCAEDVLTLIQSQVQSKSLLHCGFDYCIDLYLHQNGTLVPYVKYYDFWVGRDRFGQQLDDMHYPWFGIKDNQSRAQIINGYYRIPSFCCWNGLAILSTSPFYDYDYRWRFGQQDYQHGECASGEMGYLCEDLWTLYGNQTRIYINPSVHVAYDLKTYRAIENSYWFDISLAKQDEFQQQLRKHPILDPPETVHVPKQWQCVPEAVVRKQPFNYVWKSVRVLDEQQKMPFFRLLFSYKNEWKQA